MKKTLNAIVAAVGLFLAAAAGANPGDDSYGSRGTMAGPGDCGPRGEAGTGGGPGGQGMRGPGEAFGQGLETLKTELKLTEAQQPAWSAFEKAFKAHGEMVRSARDQRPQEGGDPMDARIAFMEKQVASLKTVSAARKELYKKLTTEQKAVMDRHSQRMAGGHRGNGQRRTGD